MLPNFYHKLQSPRNQSHDILSCKSKFRESKKDSHHSCSIGPCRQIPKGSHSKRAVLSHVPGSQWWQCLLEQLPSKIKYPAQYASYWGGKILPRLLRSSRWISNSIYMRQDRRKKPQTFVTQPSNEIETKNDPGRQPLYILDRKYICEEFTGSGKNWCGAPSQDPEVMT